jgi:peptidylprolyl isomerase
MMEAVKTGDTISVIYTGRLQDGEVFDSNAAGGAPLKFTVGAGQLIKGFDQAVLGMLP